MACTYNDAIDDVSKIIDPGKMPCDCITRDEKTDKWSFDCDCRNSGDLMQAATWCSDKNTVVAIGKLKRREAAVEMDVSSGFHIFRDGNAWCAVGPHFQDLMKSEAGFGDTPESAHAAFKTECEKSSWWRNQPTAFPTIDRFTIHR